MELSLSMQFVQMRADAEVKAAHSQTVGVEHIFLGLLKLAELHGEDIFNAPEFIMRTIDDDIAVIRGIFAASQIDTSRTRALLRYMVRTGVTSNKEWVDNCCNIAVSKAAARQSTMVWAQDMLSALMENPTDMILQVCPFQHEGKIVCADEMPGENAGLDEMSKEFLLDLTKRVRRMRAVLLSNVFGQDHVVHAFAEGVFAAEVLAASDEKRTRPRAIFVFAGPPGVGKTFLAEQAAEALNIPYKRFDMSGFADHQAYMALVGFEKSYHGAKPGTLTSFVKENRHSILLFDEIEKAHMNTINLFLQILDAGRLNDRYWDEDIFFRDTIIIFTSNACRSLYDGRTKDNAAGIPRKTILNALETELNPQTGQPFFPPMLTSRMATGWILLFNHLQVHHLEKISSNEFTRLCNLFGRQYGIEVKYDKLVPAALLLREGGIVDARTLRAQTELFFKNEIFKVCKLWGDNNFATALAQIERIHFFVETSKFSSEICPLFECNEKPEILLYGSKEFAVKCRKELPGYIIYHAQNISLAMNILGEKEICLALIDVAEKDNGEIASGTMSPDFFPYNYSVMIRNVEGAFDFASMSAGAIHDGTHLFRSIHERMPELPVYLLETEDFSIDSELEMSFIRAGARGKIVAPKDDFSVFEDMLATICREIYMQNVAARIGIERKALYFDTAPKLSSDKSEIDIRIRDFSIKRAVTADDMDSILDDIEKPQTRFLDVIGAQHAKDELQFFIDYLKNPKRFTAQGIRPQKGVLLYGPPGTGKTMLARAMAGESDATFIPCVATDFVTKYQGSGPESIRLLFKRARRYAPAVIFIDEVDAVGRKRGRANSGHGEEMALNALLAEMDGFTVDPKRPIFVMAATNFDIEEGHGGLGVIDPALARRFDCKILVDLPNADEREQFIRTAIANVKMHVISEDTIKRLAIRSMGMSLANLSSILETANRMVLKQRTILDDSILDEAFELEKHGAKKEWGYEYLERVARHEAGHALLSYLAGDKPAYLTIVSRGSHGGYMERQSGEKQFLATKKELLNRICTSLGGRAAEIIYYGEDEGVSTGAAGDIRQASGIAYAMLCKYGMDSHIGLCSLEDESAVTSEVKNCINAILSTELNRAIEVIQSRRNIIDKLVEALMQKNKLSEQEISSIIES
ncbi:MAG: AAA family ATPase [Lachnospiraceae bacterium]|nr:AAA family ATPase [Lachnospiraceae bacterium]